MRKINYTIPILFSFSILTLVFLYSCGDDVAGNTSGGNSISGTITYIDSGFYFSSTYYYAVCLYGDSTGPLSHAPITIDSVQINLTNKTAYFKFSDVPNGHYYVASTFVRTSNNNVVALFGSFGCDSDPNCPNITKITVPSSAGNGATNFRSRTH